MMHLQCCSPCFAKASSAQLKQIRLILDAVKLNPGEAWEPRLDEKDDADDNLPSDDSDGSDSDYWEKRASLAKKKKVIAKEPLVFWARSCILIVNITCVCNISVPIC